MDVSFCPYRTQVTYDPSTIETTKFEVQTRQFEVQTSKYEKPAYYNGILPDLDAEKSGGEQKFRSPHQLGK